ATVAPPPDSPRYSSRLAGPAGAPNHEVSLAGRLRRRTRGFDRALGRLYCNAEREQHADREGTSAPDPSATMDQQLLPVPQPTTGILHQGPERLFVARRAEVHDRILDSITRDTTCDDGLCVLRGLGTYLVEAGQRHNTREPSRPNALPSLFQG